MHLGYLESTRYIYGGHGLGVRSSPVYGKHVLTSILGPDTDLDMTTESDMDSDTVRARVWVRSTFVDFLLLINYDSSLIVWATC